MYINLRLVLEGLQRIIKSSILVTKVDRKRRYRRGYPVALLVGFEDHYAVLWRVFSRVIKLYKKVNIVGKRTDEKILYTFHESIISTLKPVLDEGIRSIIIASPVRTSYSKDFLGHIKKHHKYLLQSKSSNRVNFAQIFNSASNEIKVAELVKTKEFKESISDTTSEEADQIISDFEKILCSNLNSSNVIYSLKEIEEVIYKQENNKVSRKQYLLLTDKYLTGEKQKNKLHRLIQIAQNKKVKIRVIDTKTSAGSRISQFGGIVFFTKE